LTAPGRRTRHTTEILSMLLEKADIQGYLTTEDLMEAYPNVSEDRERLEAILVALRRRGVDILDPDESESPFDDLEESLDDEAATLADLSRISTDDIVGLYLKEMSRVPLLSGEEVESLCIRQGTLSAAEREIIKNHATVYSFKPRQEVEEYLKGKSIGFAELKEVPMSLEDAFIGITGKY